MKYIIEIEEKPLCVFDKDTRTFFPRLWRVKGFNSLVFDEEGLSRLEELNSDYINEHYPTILQDEYDRGYKDGRNVTETQTHDDAYKKGVEYCKIQEQNRIWEFVKKIVLQPEDGGISKTELDKIFGFCSIQRIFKSYTAQQAIKKLKAYEEEQSNKIAIRDEVVGSAGYKGVVTGFVTKDNVYVMWEDGSCGAYELRYLKKTGRTHNDITKILEDLKHD